MSDDPDLFDLEERMRSKLHVPETMQEAAEQRAIRQAHEQPLPKKVYVEKWEDGVRGQTFYFYDAAQPGSGPLFFTSHVPTARAETERLMKASVVVETKPKR